LRNNFGQFAPECLRIISKDGALVPLVLNTAQCFVNDKFEAQRLAKGFVRAIILKGRRQGASTLVGARFYHRAIFNRGTSVYILSHAQKTTDALFDVVERYQKLNPLAPHVGVANANEMHFDRLDSAYAVATAGAKAGGRGGRDITLFHGSEVAFWENAPDHFAAAVQGVPLLPGTEIVLESTANGAAGEFFERWQDAEAGRGDYQAIFVPWWVSAEYRRDPEDGFELATDSEDGELSEAEYAEVFGLDHAQMAWRRAKISELRSGALFRQEYPATPQEAFSYSKAGDPFIKPPLVLRARKRTHTGVGPLILGVDPAALGGDRFSIAARRGMEVEWVQYRTKIDAQEGTAWVRSLIDKHKPERANVDAGGIGHAIVSGLRHLGPEYVRIVRGVNFGGTSQHRTALAKVPGPWNRRAEMWARLKEWLEDELGARLPDMDMLQSDIAAPRLKPRLDGNFLLESKDEMKKRGVRSPDLADSIALTFASLEFFKDYHTPAAPEKFGVIDKPQTVTTFGEVSGGNSWMA
jgi:hypothetical protein